MKPHRRVIKIASEPPRRRVPCKKCRAPAISPIWYSNRVAIVVAPTTVSPSHTIHALEVPAMAPVERAWFPPAQSGEDVPAIAGTSSPDWAGGNHARSTGAIAGTSRAWMVWDGLTVVGATTMATLLEYHIGLIAGARHFLHGTLLRGGSDAILITLLCGFIL